MEIPFAVPKGAIKIWFSHSKLYLIEYLDDNYSYWRKKRGFYFGETRSKVPMKDIIANYRKSDRFFTTIKTTPIWTYQRPCGCGTLVRFGCNCKEKI